MSSVLHIRSSNGFYGAERVVLTLLTHLRGRGVDAHLCVISGSGDSELARRAAAAGIPTMQIARAKRGPLRIVRAIREIAAPFETIHTHDYYASIMSWLAASKRKFVVTIHGWTLRTWTLRLYVKLELLVLRAFDAVVVVDPSLVAPLQRRYKRRPLVKFIANAIDLASFRQVRAGLPRAPEGITFGCVGRLEGEKGQEYLVKAFAHAALDSAHRLIFVGDGLDRSRLEAVTQSLGCADRIEFLGALSDMNLIYSRIDCLVLPSLREGMPMVLLEALACGLPVISSDVGAVGRILTPASGILVPPGDVPALADALQQMVGRAALLAQMGAAGKEVIEKSYSAPVQSQAYCDLYQQLRDGHAVRA